MMSDSDGAIGYAAAVDAYWQAGWRSILPIPHKAKNNPPAIYCDKHRPRERRQGTTTCPDCTHYTGYTGIEPSYPDIMAWCEDFRDGNLCLRLPDGVIGIDVDNYGVKTGAAAFTEAKRRWGPLPDAPRSSSRENNPLSGIRLFRAPPGTKLDTKIAFPDLGIGDIEIIQRHHRYAVAWPSIHPEGRSYWWLNEQDQLIGIPNIDELPDLPPSWIAGLKVDNVSNLTNTPVDIRHVLTAGEPSITVHQRLSQAIKELNLPGQSRHDTCTRHVMAIARLGKSGEPGVMKALQLLCDVFVAVSGIPPGARRPDEARGEFERMVTNDNLARELATPGLTDWVHSIIVDETPVVPDQPPMDTSPAPPSTQPTNGLTPSTGEYEGASTGGTATDDIRTPSHLEEIERGFWDSRESLQMVWQTAMAKMCSPWAVLAQCAARGLAQVRPCVTLPDIIGGPGSLNWFTAITAPSGRGKGASSACARILVPENVIQRNLGTGEGILDAYIKPANKDTGEPRSVHESVMLTADEIDTLAALRSRSGSTLMGILRSGFSGETLGFSYRSNSTHLEAHSYRMTMILSVQPEKADWIIADSAGGTPQRLMWFPAGDARIAKKRPWPSGPLTLPSPYEWLYTREIVIPQEARDLIEDAQVDRNRDIVDALDGHALFCREKFAYALTVLDGRTEMTSEDWELSGIAADVSAYTREMTVDAIRAASRIDALDRGEIRGIELHAADEAKEFEAAEKVRRVLRGALAKIEAAGEEGLAQRDLDRATAHRDRRWLPGALGIAQSNGLIRLNEDGRWVKI